MSDSLRPHGLYSPWNSPGQSARVGSLSLLQGILPTQRLNPGLPHCRRMDSLPTEISGKPNREDYVSHLKGNLILNEGWLKSGMQIAGGSYGEVQNQSGKHKKWENTGKVNWGSRPRLETEMNNKNRMVTPFVSKEIEKQPNTSDWKHEENMKL